MEREEEQSQVSIETLITLDDDNDDNVSETSFNNGDNVNANANNNNNGDWVSTCSSLNGKPPAPFVLKIYDIVNDNNTNSIVSWNTTGTSLVVWDAHRFVAEVMHRYFKHNNFSSFLCQLNSYGFKKVSWDRWEYQNQWFQKGKISWLQNMKRTAGSLKGVVTQARDEEPIQQMTMLEKTRKLENLIKEQKLLDEEIAVLKKQLEDAEKELDRINTEFEISKNKQQNLIMIVAQAFLKEKKEWHDSDDVAKKPRLIEQEISEEILSENVNKISDEEKGKDKEKEKEEENGNEKYERLEKLLMDDLNDEKDPGEKMAKHESQIVIKLEDLLGERVDWAEYVKELGGKASGLEYKN